MEGRPLTNLRNLALWIVIAVLLVFLFNLFQNQGAHTAASAYSYSRFIDQVNANQVKRVTFAGEQVKGELTNGTHSPPPCPATIPPCGRP